MGRLTSSVSRVRFPEREPPLDRASPLAPRGGLATPAPHMVWQEDVQTVPAQPARLGRLALARHTPGHSWRFSPVGEALQALRGVQGPGAVTTVAALGVLRRFDTPRPHMHDRGRTPSAYARGARRQQGSLPKTGYPHARRALGEGAWAYRSPATVRRHLPLRLDKLPTALQAIRGKAQVRRCQR